MNHVRIDRFSWNLNKSCSFFPRNSKNHNKHKANRCITKCIGKLRNLSWTPNICVCVCIFLVSVDESNVFFHLISIAYRIFHRQKHESTHFFYLFHSVVIWIFIWAWTMVLWPHDVAACYNYYCCCCGWQFVDTFAYKSKSSVKNMRMCSHSMWASNCNYVWASFCYECRAIHDNEKKLKRKRHTSFHLSIIWQIKEKKKENMIKLKFALCNSCVISLYIYLSTTTTITTTTTATSQ